MICPKCKGVLEQIQTLSCPSGKTQRQECKNRRCGATWVSIVLIAHEIGDKGTGIHETMKQLKAGKIRLEKPKG
jgi:hypothetical protein